MIEVELNKSVGEILQIICINCKNINRHKVLVSVDQDGKEPMADDYYYWRIVFQIVECQGCGNISFRSEHSNSEDLDEEGHIVTELIYPKRTSETWNAREFLNLPYNLRRIYRETIDCFNNENLILCGAGIRALVEGLCKENGVIDGEIEYTDKDGVLIKKRSTELQGKINGLHEIRKLTKENAEILHEHRFLGNTSIHELSVPSKDELSLALEIIEHVFDTLYEIPQKAMKLKYARLQKEKKTKPNLASSIDTELDDF
jgi:hypothetical protein